jgi:hypothetical protein
MPSSMTRPGQERSPPRRARESALRIVRLAPPLRGRLVRTGPAMPIGTDERADLVLRDGHVTSTHSSDPQRRQLPTPRSGLLMPSMVAQGRRSHARRAPGFMLPGWLGGLNRNTRHEYHCGESTREGGGVDQQQRGAIEAQLDHLGRDAQKIGENARNALDHLRRGDVQLACDVVGLSHYPIAHVEADHDALMEAFTAAGIEPGAGRRQGQP